LRKKGSLLFYGLMIIVFGIAIYKVLQQGSTLEHITPLPGNTKPHDSLKQFADAFTGNLLHPLPTLLLQIIVIVVVVRLFGWLFNKIGQPVVIGEIVAGVVLGPSLLGAFFPSVSGSFIWQSPIPEPDRAHAFYVRYRDGA
jgi:hypothetical protein